VDDERLPKATVKCDFSAGTREKRTLSTQTATVSFHQQEIVFQGGECRANSVKLPPTGNGFHAIVIKKQPKEKE
jgi:hypothetical protein